MDARRLVEPFATLLYRPIVYNMRANGHVPKFYIFELHATQQMNSIKDK